MLLFLGLDSSGYRQSMQQRDHEDEDALLGGVQISDEEKYKDCERLEIICTSPTCGRKLVLDTPFVNAVSEFKSKKIFLAEPNNV